MRYCITMCVCVFTYALACAKRPLVHNNTSIGQTIIVTRIWVAAVMVTVAILRVSLHHHGTCAWLLLKCLNYHIRSYNCNNMSLGKQTFNLSEKGMINERIKKWIHSYCSYKKYIFPDLSIKLSLKSKLKIKKLSTEYDMTCITGIMLIKSIDLIILHCLSLKGIRN